MNQDIMAWAKEHSAPVRATLDRILPVMPLYWSSAVVLLAAALTMLLHTPIVGVPAFATIVWLNGTSLVLLLLNNPRLDTLFYTVGSVLAGIALVLFSTLALFAFSIAITDASVPLAVALVGLVLTALASRRRAERWKLRERADPLQWLYWGAAAAVLVGSTSFAAAVQKKPDNTWTLMSVSPELVRTATPIQADPGAAVDIGWTVRVHGFEPPTEEVQVATQVGEDPQDAASKITFKRTGSGADIEGVTTVQAPTEPGLYRVQLRATTFSALGNPVSRTVNVHVQVGEAATQP